jgi:hypothetical protein
LDVVLGVSMAPSTIRMVLVEGENADGVTVDEDQFAVNLGGRPATLSGPDQLIAAVLGTREGAAEAGHRLTSIGVTWTDHADAAALATALAARKIENVMLVSAFLAAAALAQTVGAAIGYEFVAMLFVETNTATLAVIDSADGSVNDVYRRSLHSADPVPELIELIAGLNDPRAYPEGLFIVGCDVDIAALKPALEAASLIPVSAPEEPDTALARGAALASANAPLFASSTAALAYAQDPGTGAIDRYAVSPGHLATPSRVGGEFGEADLAYSAAPDDEADAVTGVAAITDIAAEHEIGASPRRRPLLLAGSALAVVVVSAALALEIALALGIRPAVALRPSPGRVLVTPAQQASSPAAAQLLPVPRPQLVHLPVRLAAPPAPHIPARAPIAAPAPMPIPVPVPMHVGSPVAPVHVPVWQPRMNLAVPRAPSPQARTPFPRLREPIPQPPMNFPAPYGPRLPFMPAPMGPRFPGPMFPRMPGPMMPPAMPALPQFRFPFPSFRF